MPRKPPKNLIVADKEGTLYVRADAVMTPLVAIMDGIAVAFFGKGKKSPMYLAVDDAIVWCEKEKKYHSLEKYEGIIKSLKRIKSEAVVGEG